MRINRQPWTCSFTLFFKGSTTFLLLVYGYKTFEENMGTKLQMTSAVKETNCPYFVPDIKAGPTLRVSAWAIREISPSTLFAYIWNSPVSLHEARSMMMCRLAIFSFLFLKIKKFLKYMLVWENCWNGCLSPGGRATGPIGNIFYYV